MSDRREALSLAFVLGFFPAPIDSERNRKEKAGGDNHAVIRLLGEVLTSAEQNKTDSRHMAV